VIKDDSLGFLSFSRAKGRVEDEKPDFFAQNLNCNFWGTDKSAKNQSRKSSKMAKSVL